MAQEPVGDGFDHLDEAWLRSRPGAKWAAAGAGVIPCWVADMDFPAPAPVRDSLRALAQGADLGYPSEEPSTALERSWAARMARRYGWEPGPGRLSLFTDLVQATQVMLHVATEPGDGVLVVTPSYPPFLETLEEMGRKLLAVPMVSSAAGWELDLDGAARAAATGKARAILLANPHNPTGRVLRREELCALGELAVRHDLLVVSDEIHADLTLTEAAHVAFASLSEELAARTVTMCSATKSHNLGGMRCALAHVGHQETARKLAAFPSHLFGQVSIAALTATLAAWSPAGDSWLEGCLARLRANRALIGDWVKLTGTRRGVSAHLPDATYLAWLDFGGAGIGDDPAAWLLDKAGVMLSSGLAFGPGGAGHARLNFATTGEVLAEILARVGDALS